MVKSYKCPSCGGAMEFDGNTQKVVCAYCGNAMSVDEFAEDGNESTVGTEEVTQEEIRADVKSYRCESCGAELVTDENTTATLCAFCGNSTLIENRLKGQLMPHRLVPFRLDSNRAKDEYRKYMKKGLLVPKGLLSQSTIEKIQGIYVPFWLYDYDAECHMDANCTRVRTERRGDTEYTYTDHYHVTRHTRALFEKIPADASEKMPDREMDLLEPFDYADLKPFEMPYLAGYLSEKYNYTAEQMQERADRRVNSYIESATRDTIQGYHSTNVTSSHVSRRKRKTEYVLLPVWVLNYRYNGKEYSFTMNGQTGKIVADRPVSYGKMAGCFAISTLVTLLVTMIGGMFL